MPADWAPLTVEKQRADPGSTLSFFRAALELRRSRAEFGGTEIEWLPLSDHAVAFRRRGGLVCVLNAGEEPITLPPAGELILSSGPLEAGRLSANSAVWLV